MEKCYTIRRVTESDWTHLPSAAMDVPMWGDSFGIRAAAQLCYDDEALHVHLQAAEQEIRAENTQPLQEPCEDSCLEFFFSPIPGDLRYFNVEFNLNGCLFLGLGSSMADLVRLLPMEEDPFSFRSRRTEVGWEVTYAIPHAFVRRFFPAYAPVPGAQIRGNFYKCGDLTKHPHYLVWNPVSEAGHTFHAPANFGTLLFA